MGRSGVRGCGIVWLALAVLLVGCDDESGQPQGPGLDVDGVDGSEIEVDTAPDVAEVDGLVEVVQAVCGDGVVEGAEACDDGNQDDGDGCAADCSAVEAGWSCPPGGGACAPIELCGNGELDGDEACDDGNREDGDGCAGDCSVIEEGWWCLEAGAACVPKDVCGNKVLEEGEACDDGNTRDGDGCAGDCSVIEAGWKCPIPGRPCVPDTCGNGLVNFGEECDEGTANNDGR